MRVQRPSAPLVLCLCCVLLAACGDSDEVSSAPTAPSPPAAAPPPAPSTPSAPTFSVSGTISETAPTPNQRVAGVEVTIGAASATTDGNGAFTVAGVPAGTYTLAAARSDYQTGTMPVTVTNADVTGLRIALAPTPRIVSADFDGVLAHGDASCVGTSLPCDAFAVGAHNSGNVQAFLIWKNPNVDLDIELRCDEQLVEEAFTEGGTLEELHPTPVQGGSSCVVHVLHHGEEETLYTIYLKYPY